MIATSTFDTVPADAIALPREPVVMNSWPADCPRPGYYPHVDYDTYARWPAVNATAMLYGLESMEHLKAALDGQLHKKSAALDFGKAFHTRLLEPDIYRERYVIRGACEVILKSGDNKGDPCGCDSKGIDADGAWRCGKHCKGIELTTPECSVTREEWDRLEAMAAKIEVHRAVKLLRAPGYCEYSGTWECEGVPLKFRLDRGINLLGTHNAPPIVVDLKKARKGHVRPDKFMQVVHDEEINYDIRAALQVDAVQWLTGVEPIFIWVAVEDEYPHGISTIRASRQTLAIGRRRYLTLLNQYKQCVESGRWPTYTDDVIPGYPPEYVKRRWDAR